MKPIICKQVHPWLIAMCIFALSAPMAAQADVPMLINYQGYLTDSSGNALSGKQSVNFRLCFTETGGLCLWEEEQLVEITEGVFNVQLGAENLLPPSVFNIDTIYLEIEVFSAENGWETLIPRQQLTASAFAVRAGNADMLEGHTLSDLDTDYVNAGEADAVTAGMIADNSVGASDLGDDSVGTAEIIAGAVATAELADDAVTTAKLAGNSVSSNEVADNSLTAADLASNSVGSSEVIDNSLTAADLASSSVTASEIATGAVGSSEILDGTVTASDLADEYVNTIGDTMTGDLSISGDIHVANSGGIGDYTATFESSGGPYAYAINGIANSANYSAYGLNVDVDSANSYAYGAYVEVDAPGSFAYGTHIDVASYSAAHGIYARTDSTNGEAYGAELYSTVGSGSDDQAYGLYSANQHNGTGDLYGIRSYNNHFGSSGDGYGLYTYLTGSDTGDVKGVYSEARKYSTDTDGNSYGGHFISNNDGTDGYSYGVLGEATGSSMNNTGVYARATSSDGAAVGYVADVNITTANAHNCYGASFDVMNAIDGTGDVYGSKIDVQHRGPSGDAYGYRAWVKPGSGGNAYGIYSFINGGYPTRLVYAGYFSTGYDTANYAGYFKGNVEITGTLTKSAGSFKIDHPLDPENQCLQHSFVESPDMMNVYNGNVLLDESGAAWVDLPDYFEALNQDFRYQLTAIGTPGPNLYVAEEISDNSFKIAGGESGMKVSWQVTGIRQDAWANDHRIEVEVDKRPEEVGAYLYPEGFGLDQTRSVEFARHPEMMQEHLDMEKSRTLMDE